MPNIGEICGCCSEGRPLTWQHWKVDHNAQDGMEVQLVELEFKCSNCGRIWNVCGDSLSGIMCQVDGWFILEIPYPV